MAENNPDNPAKPQKRKGGRPKGVDSSLLNKKRRQYSYSIMERIQERVDPDILIDFHMAILQGQNPKLEKRGDTWEVVQDPSTLAIAPTLEQKISSSKWLADRGHGLPVQSTQIDIRARFDSGVSNQALESAYTPAQLAFLKRVLTLPKPQEEVIEAEFTESPAPSEPENK